MRCELPALDLVLPFQLLAVTLHDESVRLIGLHSRLEEEGGVIFECVHPRLQVGDVVLVELTLVIRALDTEVCGEEEAPEFSHKLLLRVLGTAEARVEAAIERGGVTGGMGHLMKEHAREGLIGAEGLARCRRCAVSRPDIPDDGIYHRVYYFRVVRRAVVRGLPSGHGGRLCTGKARGMGLHGY